MRHSYGVFGVLFWSPAVGKYERSALDYRAADFIIIVRVASNKERNINVVVRILNAFSFAFLKSVSCFRRAAWRNTFSTYKLT